jgi:predicted O-methyltransferase YrrM
VWSAGCHDRIIPVRGLTVPIAACLGAWGVVADFIYLDASHDELSVSQDLRAYWPLLRTGGVMAGDDFSSHEGVAKAVRRFSAEIGRAITEHPAAEGTQWSLEPK